MYVNQLRSLRDKST